MPSGACGPIRSLRVSRLANGQDSESNISPTRRGWMGTRLSGGPRAGCLLMSIGKRRGVCRLVVSVCEGRRGGAIRGHPGGGGGSEAECLGDEDDGDPAGGVAVDD